MSFPLHPCLDRFAAFVLAMLNPRRRSDGWVSIEQLMHEASCSRATAYRWMRILECQFPIERSGRGDGRRRPPCSFRCAFLVQRRDAARYRSPVTEPLSSGDRPC